LLAVCFALLAETGFKPVVYRLMRRIDQRITWAKGEVE
jgi:hypothetical protein